MPDAIPVVRVVVLNWNAAWLTTRCVRSLLASDATGAELHVVVVDNGSIDGSLQRLQTDFASELRVEIRPTGSNLGFAEGCNRGLRDLGGVDFVALINNDATVDPGWLSPLLAEMADPQVGAVGAKMLLELAFVDVGIDPATASSNALIERVAVDGIDVTSRCIFEDTERHSDPYRALKIVHRVGRGCSVAVPVGSDPQRVPTVEITFTDLDTTLRLDDTSTSTVVIAGSDGCGRARWEAIGHRHRRINNLGTHRTESGEWADRWYGAKDRPGPVPHDTEGFCGGAVLLRPSMLADIGLLDPSFFAYYEDSDLAWRASRNGWRIRVAPESVVHHLHGGSGGTASPTFFHLNYRNWLLTTLRNGSPAVIGQTIAWARRYSWPSIRRNIVGLVRRGRAPQMDLASRWLRIWADVLAHLPRQLAARRTSDTGREPTESVRSRWLPAGSVPTAGPIPGGPTLVYVDVTPTMTSGWRAGIQRVTCQVVEHLPRMAPDLHVVPIAWAPLHQKFRQISADEYALLLAPTGSNQPIRRAAPQSDRRRQIGAAARALRLDGLANRVRRQRALRAEPSEHRDLLLDRLESRSVLLEVDATWNATTPSRRELSARLVADDVTIVSYIQDIFCVTHPEWFGSDLAQSFGMHLDSHLRWAETLVTSSQDTRVEIERYAKQTHRRVPHLEVVALGADTVAGSGSPVLEPDTSTPFVLSVGTIEPRKRHDLALDAVRALRSEFPELRFVVVGREGWGAPELVEQLRTDPAVTWRHDVSDAELEELYRTALVTVVASAAEGFGLPVVEALRAGSPVIATTGGALGEIAPGIVDHVDDESADTAGEIASAIRRLLAEPSHRSLVRSKVRAFVAPTWDDCAAGLATVIRRAVQRGPGC